MPTWEAVALFIPAALAIALVPGPAVVYIVTRSVEQGRQAGLVSAGGAAVGNSFHAVAAALGLSLVVARSAELFTAIKLAGAVYLIALGVSRLISRSPAEEEAAVEARTSRVIFRQAIVVNVLNPKVAIFFLALFPQFVTPGRSTVTQMLVLGVLFTALVLMTDSTYACASAFVAARIKARRAVVERITGLVYIALGVFAALARRPIERAA